MMEVSDFGEGWVSSPIEQWATMLVKSGVWFWIGGVLAWWWQSHLSVSQVYQWVFSPDHFHPVPTLVTIFLLLMLMTTFASLVREFDLLVLRLLEGYYWPKYFQRRFVQRQQKRLEHFRAESQALLLKPSLTPEETARLAELQQLLGNTPETLLPTRLGNLLRSYEERPRRKYGLEAFICWPHLWLVMPDHARQEVAKARSRLDTLARLWSWGGLFLIWTVWTYWAVPVSLLVISFAYWRMLDAAAVYGHFIEVSFDLYRSALYKQLEFTFPNTRAKDQESGEALTEYLWRGGK